MKSLLIVDRYMPHNGGSRRYYHELARRLPDVAVLTGHQPGGAEFDATSRVRTIRRKGIRPNYAARANRFKNPVLNLLFAYLPGIIATVFWTTWEVLRHRPKVLHAGGYAFAGLAACLVAPMFRIPYLVFAHGEDVSSTAQRRFFNRYMCLIFKRAKAIVVNCRNTGELVRSCGIDPSRIVVATPGVDNKWVFSDPQLFSDGFKRESQPCLLSVGRLVPHKGHVTMLKALPGLIDKWPRLRWVLVGVGPEKQKLEQLVSQLGLKQYVYFLSGLTDAQLQKCYEDSDLFVLPNGEVGGMSEGYGMVFLEAGASGLAVVGGKDGGVPEAVIEGETGLLVPPFNENALANSVTRLLRDHTLRRRMGTNGRRLALSRTWDHTLSSVIDLETGLLAGSA